MDLDLTCLVDHAYLDNGLGVLVCVAGSDHTADQIIGCPYYLRTDIAAQLPAQVRPRWTGQPGRRLRYHGGDYLKLAQLAPTSGWRTLIGALPPAHGLSPLPWSLAAALDPGRIAGWVEGGPPADTNMDDNLRSIAIMLAALDSAKTGTTRQVEPT